MKKMFSYYLIILVGMYIGLIAGCCREEIIPDVDPCEVWPDPPYGVPDSEITYVQFGSDYRTIQYIYDCLGPDTEYVISSFVQNSQTLKSDSCWTYRETRNPDGVCDLLPSP